MEVRKPHDVWQPNYVIFRSFQHPSFYSPNIIVSSNLTRSLSTIRLIDCILKRILANIPNQVH